MNTKEANTDVHVQKAAIEVKWLTLDNENETRTSCHGYVMKKYNVRYSSDEYEGNVALCSNNLFASEDGESAMPFDNITDGLSKPPVYACKKCLKKLNKNQ